MAQQWPLVQWLVVVVLVEVPVVAQWALLQWAAVLVVAVELPPVVVEQWALQWPAVLQHRPVVVELAVVAKWARLLLRTPGRKRPRVEEEQADDDNCTVCAESDEGSDTASSNVTIDLQRLQADFEEEPAGNE